MSTASRSWADGPHLVRRFFASWRPRHLSPDEQLFLAGHLSDAEADVFWSQQPADLRHALDCARYVADRQPGRRDLIRAAMLHDLGKRSARLGPIGRSLATMLGLLGIRGSERHHSYNRHSEEGAEILVAAGAEDTVVAYARHHHTGRPEGFDPGDWDLLMTADRAN